jgi:hypothetical protein
MPIEHYRLVVTDITEFGTLRCVAGWDTDRNCMIRPEPHPGGFWQTARVGPASTFAEGATIEFDGQHPTPATPYPHMTEDRVVVGAVTRTGTLTGPGLIRCLANTISPSIAVLFGGHLQTPTAAGFVSEGTQRPSLGAIEVDAIGMLIYDDTDWGKKRLRCSIPGAGRTLHPSITSLTLRKLYRQGGTAAAEASLVPATRLHLRIGLARAFPAQPGKCYLQVNGIYVRAR